MKNSKKETDSGEEDKRSRLSTVRHGTASTSTEQGTPLKQLSHTVYASQEKRGRRISHDNDRADEVQKGKCNVRGRRCRETGPGSNSQVTREKRVERIHMEIAEGKNEEGEGEGKSMGGGVEALKMSSSSVEPLWKQGKIPPGVSLGHKAGVYCNLTRKGWSKELKLN